MGVMDTHGNPIYFDGRGGGHQDHEGPLPSQLQGFMLGPVDEDAVTWLETVGFGRGDRFINGIESRPDVFLSEL